MHAVFTPEKYLMQGGMLWDEEFGVELDFLAFCPTEALSMFCYFVLELDSRWKWEMEGDYTQRQCVRVY